MLVALETYHHLYAQVDQCLASGLAIKSSTCVDVHKVDATTHLEESPRRGRLGRLELPRAKS